MNSKRLGSEHNRNSLHNGSTIHIDSRTKRNGKRRNLLGNTHLLVQRINRKRNSRIGGCSGKGKGHNREKLSDKLYWIQAREQLQQNLVYTKTLDCQSDQNCDHIFCQRHKCAETNGCKGSCDQTEYTNRSQTHNHHGHFHHNIIKLADKVGNGLRTLPKLCQDHTNDQSKHYDLKHFPTCQGLDGVIRNNIENSLNQRGRLHSLNIGSIYLDLTHIKTNSRSQKSSDSKGNCNCHRCCDQIKCKCFSTYISQLLSITDSHTSTYQ